LERVEAVVEQALCRREARPRRLGAEPDIERPNPSALSGSDYTVSCTLRVADLQAVDRGVSAQQAVPVVLAYAVVRELLLGEEPAKLREIVEHGPGEAREIPRRAQMTGRGEPRRIAKGRRGHAERLGPLVHQRDERLLRARDPFGERDRRVVARLHDEPA